ncbi:hypothetical protein WT55_23495 [Burkholderia pseudomultivorans]|nr:hypothetical protein WT55_23495 [Burkholderia pseudomultivorans]
MLQKRIAAARALGSISSIDICARGDRRPAISVDDAARALERTRPARSPRIRFDAGRRKRRSMKYRFAKRTSPIRDRDPNQ